MKKICIFLVSQTTFLRETGLEPINKSYLITQALSGVRLLRGAGSPSATVGARGGQREQWTFLGWSWTWKKVLQSNLCCLPALPARLSACLPAFSLEEAGKAEL